MNVIFLTISRINDINERGIYTDLMRKFRDEGHNVYIVTPYERQFGLLTSLKEVDGIHILGVRTLNIQKTNVVEKGIATILIETQYRLAIKRYFSDLSFDLILYSTPPITFTNIVKYLKKRNPNSISYLLLKDIFPQNAVDLGILSKRNLFYSYFRKKEKNLYRNSDYIGCMSPANVRYILKHNSFISAERVEVAPNSIEIVEKKEDVDKGRIREKYNLPADRPIFIYGGNLGKPQGVDFLINCLEHNGNRKDCHFLIVGNGTEYSRLEKWIVDNQINNISLFPRLSKKDYDALVSSCDIGLVFLDYRFKIPNYPSRLLSYLECKMPIIAATDVNTDIGIIAEENGYGYWCESVDVNHFTRCVDQYLSNPAKIKTMGEAGYQFLLNNYSIKNTYEKIIKHLK
ncbi:glycosyltransferase family 4 protein [Bacteroides pyogenes]|uniref:glycosyltransferase family 4 protein n=1 Tax=Bacteroides pyogenes TaxID=310300 RepID=UPI0003DDE0E0|nr:glycosyltransferase family 4 protein [Bacteroides pyogenes]MBB3894805.1 glycosyltransferase involved in cell wall biosynthesis [Bacteroides pyogenes]GAE21174.1 putative glycosyltransferase [Bacteroides pyogenes JCM 10003]SUV35258.1 putative glycosyltransferase [Bacteroides pyogenes]